MTGKRRRSARTRALRGTAVEGLEARTLLSASSSGPTYPLAFFGEPVNTMTGMLGTVTVFVEQPNGTPVASDSSSMVTLSIASGPPGGILGGTVTMTPTAGVATFTNLSVSTPGSYTLMAVDGMDTPATSARFAYTQTPYNSLSFVPAMPTISSANATLGTLMVDIDNPPPSGGVATNDDTTVTLAVASPAGATVTGATSVAAVNGVATFTGLSFSPAGSYVLVASDGNDNAAISNFLVNELAFTSGPPLTGTTSTSLGPVQVSVENPITDATVTTDTSVVTLAVASGPAGAMLPKTTAEAAVNGMATFSDLSFPIPGVYTLTATDGTYAVPTSTTFTISSAYALQVRAALGSNPNVLDPNGGLTLVTSGMLSGDLLGTTSANGTGSVFELVQNGAFAVPLANFSTAGSTPNAGVVADSSGDVFGTTSQGGAFGMGQVFEIAFGSSSVTALASFNGVNGMDPIAGLVRDSSGDLYVATQFGGANGMGTVFEIPRGTSSITPIASFNGANGSQPVDAFDNLDSSDNLYGTTEAGGANNLGAVFEILAGTSSIELLASFNGMNGSDPAGSVGVDSSGDVFGTTQLGGGMGMTSGAGAAGAGMTSNLGTLFEIPSGATTITTVASMNATTGMHPTAGVIVDSSGDVFGTAGAAVFELPAAANTIQFLATFNAAVGQVEGGLTLDSSGDIFGTFVGGISANYASGAVFELINGNLSPMAGNQLIFTTEPASVSAPSALPPIAVTVENSNGATVTSDSSQITLSLATPNNGAMLMGAAPVTVANGFATFTGLSITTSGTYTLIATDQNDGYGISTSFTVGNQLVFTHFPSNMATGSLGMVTVDIENAAGSILTTDNNQVMLSLISYPNNGATIVGTTTTTAANGIATFMGLKINTAGTYALMAADITDSAASISPSFTLTSAPAGETLIFNPQPSFTSSGGLAPVTVYLDSSNGELISNDTPNVSLTLSGDGAALFGDTNVTAINGVATFNGLAIPTPGSYMLKATDTTSQSQVNDTSQSFADSTLVASFGRVRLSPQVIAGAPLNAKLAVVVKNNGGPVTGAFSVQLYVNSENLLSANAVSIGSMTKKKGLQSGKETTFQFSVPSLPSTLPPGQYYILAEVIDPSGDTNTTVATRTVQVNSPPVTALAVTVGTVSPVNLAQGEFGSILVTVTNQGNMAASGGIEITLAPSADGVMPLTDVVLDTVTSGARIPAGQSRKFRLRFQVKNLKPGFYSPYLTVMVGNVPMTYVGTTQFTIG